MTSLRNAKIQATIVVWLLFLVSGLFAADNLATTPMKRVYGYQEADQLWEFFVPEARFKRPSNDWDPNMSEFPADLGALSEKARDHFKKEGKLQNDVVLREIKMHYVQELVIQHAKNKRERARACVLAFWFRGVGRNGALYTVPVVMLLDGTIAEMRPGNAREAEQARKASVRSGTAP